MAVGGGGAGGCGGFIGASRAVLDGDVACGEVDDGTGDEEGRDLARATVEQVDVLALNDIEAADAGANVDANPVMVFFGDLEAGALHRFGRRGERKVDEAAHLAGLFFVHKEQWVEVFDLGGKANGVTCEIEGFDLGHTAAASEEAFPDLRGVLPTPQMSPRPVTTTRRCSIFYLAAFWFFSM